MATAAAALARRRRFLSDEEVDTTPLNRCMSVWSLCLVGGGGAAAGAGAHVVAGGVAARVAGPALVLSFILAGLAAMLAGLCMSEMSARLPRAGSAYVWTRALAGDAPAALLGWTLLLDLMFGSASVARGLSAHVDSLTGGRVSAWSRDLVPLTAPFLAAHFDILALLIVLLVGGVLLVGVRQGALMMSVLTAVNLAVLLLAIVAGAFKASPSNWRLEASAVPAEGGAGGFLPYGTGGAVRGAAICFYGYVGFDVISFAGEEARDARRSLPLAIMSVIGVSMVVYCALAIVLTMMVPYYLQDSTSTIATVFSQVGWEWAGWIVAVGAIFGILASLVSGLYALSRLVYSMSSEGALWGGLARVTAGGRSPARAGGGAVLLVALLSSLVEVEQLVMTICIGTLLSYTVVALCVLMLRYGSDSKSVEGGSYIAQLFGCGERKSPSILSARIVYVALSLFVCVSVAAAVSQVCGAWGGTAGAAGAAGAARAAGAAGAAGLHAGLAVLLLVMCLQPTTHHQIVFKTPMVPLVPLLSIYVNIHLMAHISAQTWIRLCIWILIGVPIYLLSFCCRKKYEAAENLNVNVNGKSNSPKLINGIPPVEIVVEPPTPVSTLKLNRDNHVSTETAISYVSQDIVEEEILVQQAIIDDNREREAKIIDLIDQVLQAEEDSYKNEDIFLIEDQKTDDDITQSADSNTMPYSKSFSELSDAGSEASASGAVISKYDVIAQVHREDNMSVLSEEPVVLENTEPDEPLCQIEVDENENKVEQDAKDDVKTIDDHEQVTSFNESETNSGTDESGYSDTTDVNTLQECAEESDAPRIPSPPPMDESYFSSPGFKKSYTISARPIKPKVEEVEENKMRESVQSGGSCDEDNIVFGSARQQNFMSKLNNIFQIKITNNPEDDVEPPKSLHRSQSTGNLSESAELTVSRERPQMFLDMKKELLSRDTLRPMEVDQDVTNVDQQQGNDSEPEVDHSLSREHLKSKLENLFASGGPKPFKTPVRAGRSETAEQPAPLGEAGAASSETGPKLPTMDKNDTLKRQKTIFGEVLNSFRMSLNKDDQV